MSVFWNERAIVNADGELLVPDTLQMRHDALRLASILECGDIAERLLAWARAIDNIVLVHGLLPARFPRLPDGHLPETSSAP